ncbi:hypothetical protein [Curtobacterium ammoniigenes]|uniref:hypothetical protein n=1 Tax=Curtobacterium ammoniigenes TaxID=395387 RepID=UPI00082952AB|nr:hypothetical protein [Curtobacterium ammoniigenes]
MTDYLPGNDSLPSETPLHDRTVAREEGYEVQPGVALPSWAAPTQDERASDGERASDDDGPSRSDAAKDAARHVAGDAGDAGQRVGASAKEQASNVASQATDHAKQMLGEAGDALREQAGEQQQRAAGGLRSISEQLHQMAEGASEQTVASRIVRDLSSRTGSAAAYLEGRDPGSLVSEVKAFAARRPGTFIAIAAGAGILAGRLTKALTSEARHEHQDSDGDSSEIDNGGRP